MRTFQQLHQPTGRTLSIDEQQFLFFGGTAYLGLLTHPDYIALFKGGIDRYGLNNGTSRSNNVQLGIYDEAEQALSLRFGFGTSALFSSGYLAAQAAVSALTEGKKVYYAPESHPALWRSGKPQTGNVHEDWLKQTIQEINTSTDSDFVLISNTLDNLTPKAYDFAPISTVHPDKKLTLILDDSHGIAICNKNAISIDPTPFAQENIDVVIVASLAKGLGTDAGIVLGNPSTIKQVKTHPIFMGGSPASPASIYALLQGREIYDSQFNALQANISFLDSFLPTDQWHRISRFPVFTSENPHVYRHLLKQNILISSFPYPLPTSPLLNRIVVSALHQQEDLERLVEVLAS